MSQRARKVNLILLLVLGALVWGLCVNAEYDPPITLKLGCAGIAASFIPGLRRRLRYALVLISHPSDAARRRIAFGIGLLTSAYLYVTASWQGRTFQPRWHDEFMALLQARMMSIGRLWMPPLPNGDFFDSFYVFVEPVYSSLTWPGASLLWVPGMWLGLPYWVMPLLAAGACGGLLYWIVTELLDGAAGLLASLALSSLVVFRQQSLQSQAQVPILLGGLLFVWAFLRWRRNPRVRNSALIGIIAGWAAVTRPVDAVCLAVPVGLAMLGAWWRMPSRARLATAAAVVAGAAPLLALQLVFNYGVTGSVMTTPHAHYRDRDLPSVGFGFPTYDPTLPLHTKLLQKHVMYREFILPAAEKHSPRKIPIRVYDQFIQTLYYTLPHPLLVLLLPAGLMHAFARQRYVLWGALPLFLVLYSLYPFFFAHYTLFVAPTVILIMLLGLHAVRVNFRSMGLGATLAVAGITISMFPEPNRRAIDNMRALPIMDFSMVKLPALVEAPAIVLFRFHPGLDYHEEPVYNVDTAWPYDAPIIRAHDLGAANNVELLKYFAQHQPQRRFYAVDRRDPASFVYIGRADALWAQMRARATPAATTTATTRATTTATSQPAGQSTSEPLP
ncbi:MAG: hypothetical protein WBD40_03440 [Tepidisphaeraceae bacterium]